MKVMTNCILLVILFFYSKEIAPATPEKRETPIVKLAPKMDTTKTIVNELHILHPAFRNQVIELMYECRKQGIELRIVETYRTHERQDLMKKKRLSGLSGGRSKHQHFLAVDLVPIVNGKPTWHNYQLWKKIGQIGESKGLIWGGRWRKLKDFNHFEYNCPLDSVNNIPIPDTVIIPIF